ncbi:probable fructose-2,6-bisphosphatase TIGAR A isoform X1 [Nerophis lumbriciformis]|uniref:probable fructose-2,6-bisphosphatase TIGAR A isoform X1 n=1 Tax=Nerophis lumbriciformis TaxID=546530 RepID=UPI002AE08FA1|nr:probable fructose-2,6-bisphosphatase TIGAR A isoform X1 [Nerophis lumbriciformis]
MRRTCNFVNTLQEMKALTIGLTFVRHGETQFNKDGLLQGQAIDCPLSEVGLQQAADAGRYLKDVKFTNVFVSDMLRARQTAETIMKHNSSCLCLQLVCDPLLKEKSFGMAEGQCLQDVKEMAKTAGQSFLDFTPPQGETREQVKRRVQEFWLKMLHQMGCEHWPNNEVSLSTPAAASPHVEGEADDIPVHALVVGHGAYMYVAMCYLVDDLHCSIPQGCTRAHMFSLSPNAGVSRFVLTLNKEEDAFKVSDIRCLFVNKGDHVKT